MSPNLRMKLQFQGYRRKNLRMKLQFQGYRRKHLRMKLQFQGYRRKNLRMKLQFQGYRRKNLRMKLQFQGYRRKNLTSVKCGTKNIKLMISLKLSRNRFGKNHNYRMTQRKSCPAKKLRWNYFSLVSNQFR